MRSWPPHQASIRSFTCWATTRRSPRSDHRVSTANTHVVVHGGRLLALEDGGFPYELTPDLDTIGPFTFGGALETPMTAHPKICPITGELLFFGASVRPPHLTGAGFVAAGPGRRERRAPEPAPVEPPPADRHRHRGAPGRPAERISAHRRCGGRATEPLRVCHRRVLGTRGQPR
ncbi:uncharacterized protein SOCE836_033120 [Sorangium cellulosum]|uniref:Uncharacterized protein n=1 Tax=Sorangium cellulosum TaxID=56 RepID=A0A4P2QM90_SORCE|nr:uncharacterized protein SOCE836_033120 [Sorangium cellulosum]